MAPSAVRGTKRTNATDTTLNKKAKLNNNKKAAPVEPESESESENASSEDELDSASDSGDVLDQSSDSEDELDQDSEDDGFVKLDQEGENAEEDNEDKPIDPNKKSSAEQHAEQRKLLQERKLQRKSGVEVQHIKSLWERLRVKHPKPPKEVREKLCEEIWKYSKDVIRDLVLKHDASRVVQTLVKYTTRERRDIIAQSLKTHYYELATSSYGKYLLVKMLHYGSKDARELILSELHGKLRKLMRHREGAYVVEDLFVLYSTAEQKKQMIREFWGAEYAVFKDSGKGKTIQEVCGEAVEKRTLIAKNLSGTITASVEKGSTGFQILHAAMKEYVQIINDEETRELIELLNEQFAELIHTPEGCEVACTLIARANAKERKQIVKTLKEHAINLIKNEYGNLVLITLFLTVDDTVMVDKAFHNEFAEKIVELVVDKYARRPFIYLLTGLDGRYFSPVVKKELQRYIDLSQLTSKKPLDQRRRELLEKFSPIFYSAIEKNITEVLQENIGAQFVSEVFLNNAPVEDSKREAAINSLIQAFQGDLHDEESLIFKPFSVRLLKSLIQCGKWDAKNKKLIKLDIPGLGEQFANQFYSQVIAENLIQWTENKDTSFVIVALFENLENNSDFHRDLKKVKKLVKKAAIQENKGSQLLVKLAGF
jgi:pumilio family protein 6